MQTVITDLIMQRLVDANILVKIEFAIKAEITEIFGI